MNLFGPRPKACPILFMIGQQAYCWCVSVSGQIQLLLVLLLLFSQPRLYARDQARHLNAISPVKYSFPVSQLSPSPEATMELLVVKVLLVLGESHSHKDRLRLKTHNHKTSIKHIASSAMERIKVIDSHKLKRATRKMGNQKK